MGRGEGVRASSAKGLLYGPRRLGPGPDPTRPDQIDEFIDDIANGRLSRIGQKARLMNPERGSDAAGDYVQAEVHGVWNEPVLMIIRHQGQRGEILFDYSSIDFDPDGPVPQPGTHHEMLFFSELAQRLNQGDWFLNTAFEHEDQIDPFVSAYGAEPLLFAGTALFDGQRQQSQVEVIEQMAQYSSLLPEDLELLDGCQSFADVWVKPGGRDLLDQLADHGELCLRRPLSQFRLT